MSTISSSGISSTGLGTGLDIDSIVSALVKAQTSAKQNQIDNLTSSYTTQLSAVGTLKSALSTFQLAVASLNSADSFSGLAATSSDSDVATATVDSSATAGSYSLEVSQLATSSKVASQYVDASTSYGAGKLKLSQGDSTYTVSIAAGASLSDIRDSINKLSSTSGISANIITDSTGSRLVLSSTTTGSGTDISVTTSGDSSLSALSIDGTAAYSSSSGGYLTQATDAQYTLDGLSMTSSSNTVSSAVSGVTFELAATGSATVSVATNTEALTTNIQSFVDAYNTLMTTISSLTSVTTTTDEDGNTSSSTGALTSDSMTRSLVNGLRNQMVNLSSGSGSLVVLSQLGITSNKDGTLSVDSSKLSSGLSTYASDVQSFFTGSDGFLKGMYNAVEQYSKTDGLLDQKEDSINSTLSSLTTQQTDLDTRTAKLTEILYAKYNAMDTLVAQLNATSSSVLTTLNALNSSDDD